MIKILRHTRKPQAILRIAGRVLCGVILQMALEFGPALAAQGSLVSASPPPDLEKSSSVLFNRDIRPILSDACFQCHGFDAGARKADLRLDTFEGATAVRQGRQAVQPGDLTSSEVWRRITSTDQSIKMPPPDSGKKLIPSQVALLKQWIEGGAKYQKHWAFEPPQRSEPPAVKQAEWPRNDMDRFILAKLEALQLTPSPEASRETLIRRVTLDLTGLPPTLEEVDAFLADRNANAYERLVDRLLASPRYGEHMARYWLDLARYGDTHGLHLDNERSMWAYRDWVVEAFNRNLSFDQFTIEQLAGDLLPNPTRDQKVASGFNRCNVTTSEGGAIDEEFQVRYAVDRVETTSTTWLGLTMGCAACHDHKLDPITQKEFYQMFSVFNNISEKAMDGNALLPPPILKLPSAEQQKQLDDFATTISGLEKKLREAVKSLNYADPATVTNAPPAEPKEIVWVEDDFPAKAVAKVNEGNLANRWVASAEGPVFSGMRSIQRTGTNLHQVLFEDPSEPLVTGGGDRLFAHVYLDPNNTPKAIMLQFRVDNSWSKRVNWGDEDAIPYGEKGKTEKVLAGNLPPAGQWTRLEIETSRLGLRPGTKITGLAFTQHGGNSWWDQAGLVCANDPALDPSLSFKTWEGNERQLLAESKLPEEIKKLLKKEPIQLEEKERQKMLEHFLEHVYVGDKKILVPAREEMKAIREKRDALDKEVPATLISEELEKPRPAWVLIRGQYDKHGEPVNPGVPAVLPPLPSAEVTNRLTFARWLVDTNHPLTARVTVNRIWQQFFGTGLVKTSEDFGAKGEYPSHPELLDWLATEFVRTGWDLKHFVRALVTSATYRQDSAVTPHHLKMDPENRLLARGPRLRLDAEVLRDASLYLGGLLNLKMGGRGVRTYQPPGIWEAVGYTTSNTAKYEQDKGDALFRRSLYLFWKRTAPPPSMTTLDAPSRESCTPRRERTNTPLQALLMMNDIPYFEAARQLGARILHQGGPTDTERLRYGFRLVTARSPSEKETSVLEQVLQEQRDLFKTNVEAARQAISVGDSPVPADLAASELAAYAMVANLLINLDEAVTKN